MMIRISDMYQILTVEFVNLTTGLPGRSAVIGEFIWRLDWIFRGQHTSC